MGLIPNDKPGKVAFFNAKIAPWTANAVAIGTTAAAVTDLTAKLATAGTKLDAQVAAQEVAKAATAAADEAVAALVTAGVDIIKQVRVKASTDRSDGRSSFGCSSGVSLGYVISSDRYFKRDDVGIVYQSNVVPDRQRGLVGATLPRAVLALPDAA